MTRLSYSSNAYETFLIIRFKKVSGDKLLQFRKFQAFEVCFHEDAQGVALVFFDGFLKAVPVGIWVVARVLPGVNVGQGSQRLREKSDRSRSPRTSSFTAWSIHSSGS